MAGQRRTVSQRSELTYDVHEFGLNLDTREVFLMADPLLDTEEIDYRAANCFIKNLSLLDRANRRPIIVHQCTCGGDWHYGMAIYDAILMSRSPVIVVAHAHARSMSSIIPQAARVRVLMPNADFLIHFGTAAYDGDSRSFEAEADWSRQLNDRMLDIYAARLAKSEHFHRKRWGRERIKRDFLWPLVNQRREAYFTAREAVELGFMDGVLGTRGYETLDKLRRMIG